MTHKNPVQALNIQQLLNNDEYIIPLYQRNYAWGDEEIELLITDIAQAQKRNPNKNYYIGSLVVYQRNDGQLEVIDGQQRLTTFTILKAFFNKQGLFNGISHRHNIHFEYRHESDKALADLLTHHQPLPANFQIALQAIQKHWKIHAPSPQESQELAYFVLNHVEIIRTEVPPETDLNHYFEIMNTRGEQLEKHEILKSRFLSQIHEKQGSEADRKAFACIWDACSDMNRYMVMGFPAQSRVHIFGKTWQTLPTSFDEISAYFQKNNETDSSNTHGQTIFNILKTNTLVNHQHSEHVPSERFNSVIDFPNFLMLILRIYTEEIKQHDLEQVKALPLDEKNLLENYQVDCFSLDEIKLFALLLCQCRYLFDCYVIKSDTSQDKDDHWSLLTIQPQDKDKNKYQYNNSFSHTDAQYNIIMLLSMFHVSHPSRLYKNWLYATLRWLYQNREHILQKSNEIFSKKYIKQLENLSDRYYFGYYGDGIEFFDLITQTELTFQASSARLNILNSGTHVPNFIFNRLDYLLWKRNPSQNFRFTFRSSVEHFYPQNPIDADKNPNLRLDKDVLDNFGNLCLVSASINSKFSNNMPGAKRANFGKSDFNNLKLSLMMKQADNWNDKAIQQHATEMLAILNQQAQS